MKSPYAILPPMLAACLVAVAGCGGGVEASGCFDSDDLVDGRQVGVAVHNSCSMSATCVIAVAYRCDGTLAPALRETFSLEPLGVTEQWVEIPCAAAYTYAVSWQCADEGTPEVADPSI